MASTSLSLSNIGNVAIIFSLIATCIALIIHSFIAIKEHKYKTFQEITSTENIYHYGLIFYILSFIFISISLASLTIGFITHDYSFKYVYENSSNNLPTEFLISAVWAGQEGSFLFWLWITVLVGFILYKKPLRMLSNYALIPVFIFIINLLLILLKSNPFLLLAEVPEDGLGLNPLLEDFWMVFHPPMLFLGYASMILPFSLAFSSMIRREYDTWINFGIKYSILGILTLGIGIILGAYWAYKVLGWGGYWGWDNVENVSLIPWLIVIALLHLLIVQKYKKCLIKTNLFLAICSFILIIYGSCLTRSGILSDFSKHSFVDYGIGNYLLLFLLQFITIGFAPFISLFMDKKNLNEKSLGNFTLNREWGLTITSCLFISYAFLILLGTSYPLITSIINGISNSSNVSINYYETISLPIGCLLTLMLIFLPFLKWSNIKTVEWKKLISSFICSIILSFIVSLIYIIPELS